MAASYLSQNERHSKDTQEMGNKNCKHKWTPVGADMSGGNIIPASFASFHAYNTSMGKCIRCGRVDNIYRTWREDQTAIYNANKQNNGVSSQTEAPDRGPSMEAIKRPRSTSCFSPEKYIQTELTRRQRAISCMLGEVVHTDHKHRVISNTKDWVAEGTSK